MLSNKLKQLKTAIIKESHPVDSLYISFNTAQDPTTLFGGVWEKLNGVRIEITYSDPKMSLSDIVLWRRIG